MKNKIVFLDAGSVDYGDISLKAIARLGSFKKFFSTKGSQMKKHLEGADLAVLNKCRCSRELLFQLPKLKGIFITATGTDIVDLQAARERGIAVCNVPGYSTDSVVQFTIGFLLSLAGNMKAYDEAAHDGRWSRSPFFAYGAFPIKEVSGKKIGILGYGAIGSGVAKVASALGMKVLISQIPGRVYSEKEKKKRLPFEKVVRESDFLTIHTPLTSLTRDLINAKVLRKMKKGACLINMGRGGIVDEQALAAALKSGHLAGAATDVLSQEPPPSSHVLLNAPRLLMSPHVAWASFEARTRLVEEVAKNIQAFLKGKKRNRVV